MTRLFLSHGMQRLVMTMLAALAASTVPHAVAECVERKDVSLLIGMDVSPSMLAEVLPGVSRLALARDFAIEVVQAVDASATLDEAQAFTFCAAPYLSTGWQSPGNVVANLSGPIDSCDGTAVYDAIINAATALRTRSSSNLRLGVIMTDGEDVSSYASSGSAAAALSGGDVVSRLVFIGAGSGVLSSIANSAGGPPLSEAISASAPELSSLIGNIVEATCTNHRPEARLSLSDLDLQLGHEGFSITFDGTSSTDQDPGHRSALVYRWRLTAPDGSTSDFSGSTVHAPFDDNYLPQEDWSVRLTVEDPRGSTHSRTASFRVIGSPPDITVSGADINALETLEVTVSPANDVDGGSLDFQWEVLAAPPGGQYAAGNIVNGSSLSFLTEEGDIGEWAFRCTAIDDEGEEDTDTISLLVNNLPPDINLIGDEEIDAGFDLQIETTEVDDPDNAEGGGLEFKWDIIQAPQSSTLMVQEDFHQLPLLIMSTDAADAGTWVFRLTVTDDELPPWQEEVTEEFSVLVDGLPEAEISGPSTVGSLSFPVTLSGEDSVDPDSPCESDAYRCHDTLDGGLPSGLSPGIVRYTWTLLDVPYDAPLEYLPGRVDDALGLPAEGATLTIGPGDLVAGDWLFQLEVEDGEGNTDAATFQLSVIDEGGPPWVWIMPPFSRYTVDGAGVLGSDVKLSGLLSMDYDNVLLGETPDSGLGITDYAWSVPRVPPGCTPGSAPSGPDAVDFELYAAGTVPSLVCLGYYEIGLAVTDDDSVPKTGSAQAYVSLGSCDSLVCVDFPLEMMPHVEDFTDRTDVLIYYHVDSLVYDNPLFVGGLFARLRIFHESDPVVPFYTAHDPNVISVLHGGSMEFKWDGRGSAGQRPRPGRYSIDIDLVDMAMTSHGISDRENNAILIAVAEPSILPGSSDYVVRENLADGSDQVQVEYQIDGGATLDDVAWEALDASDVVVAEGSLGTVASGTLSWNGADHVGDLVPAGDYRILLRALRGGGVLGESAEHTVKILRLDLDADTSRDGLIDDVADDTGEDAWVKTRGAVFAVNLDRDGGRTAAGRPIPDAVHFDDAGDPVHEDFEINGAADEADITPFVIRNPGTSLPPSVKVFLRAAEQEDIESVHVFKQISAGETAIWGALGGRVGDPAPPLELDVTRWVDPGSPDFVGGGPGGDVTFGLEGMFFRFVGMSAVNPFDGEIDFTLELRDGGAVVASDQIRMKVAPWIMLPHSQPSESVWVLDTPGNASFRETASADAGYVGLDHSTQMQAVGLAEGASQWFQDHGEMGYYERPGGAKVQAGLRLPYRRNPPGPQPPWMQTRLLGPDFAIFQMGVDVGGGAGDYGGNVELLPPTPAFPLGRIVVGDTRSDALFDFFASQEVQPPFEVPTAWLSVSHVDEIFGFSMVDGEVIVASPAEAWAQLQTVPVADRGRSVLFAMGAAPEDGAASADSIDPQRLETGVDHTGAGWGYVRIYNDDASGSGARGQVAEITTLGNGFIEIGRVWNTFAKLLPDGSGDPNAYENVIRTAPPSQMGWFAQPQSGDKYVLVEDTRLWRAPAPAFITVEEVLDDTEMHDFNLITVQDKIQDVINAMDAAAGAPLTYIEVPTLYVGARAGFDAGRFSVAFTPGAPNFQPVNGHYYFPRQFGARDVGSGDDIFEALIRGLLPNVEYVDDWDLYHRLDGEVHCGSNVVRQPYGLDWWSNQP